MSRRLSRNDDDNNGDCFLRAERTAPPDALRPFGLSSRGRGRGGGETEDVRINNRTAGLKCVLSRRDGFCRRRIRRGARRDAGDWPRELITRPICAKSRRVNARRDSLLALGTL